jgi:hypothetical protein
VNQSCRPEAAVERIERIFFKLDQDGSGNLDHATVPPIS